MEKKIFFFEAWTKKERKIFCRQLHWDDNEEKRYRDWLRSQQQEREQEAEWSELDGEVAYRSVLKRGRGGGG